MIDAGVDNSLTQVSYLDGLLTTAMPSAYTWGNGQRSVAIVEWFVLNPENASVFSQGAFGTPGLWLFYPSAVRNSKGQMLFVYSISGPTIYPGLAYANLLPTTTTFLAQGNSYYAPPAGAHWGSYYSALLDMRGSNPNGVWITGEYAPTTNSWGSAFVLVIP